MQEESGTPGTSVPYERSFSTTGHNAKRACLLPDNIEILPIILIYCVIVTVYTIIMIMVVMVTIIVI